MSVKTLYNRKFLLSMILLLNFFSLHMTSEQSANNDQIKEENMQTKDQVDPNREDLGVFGKILSIRVRHIKALEKILSESDITHLAYFFVKDSENSKRGAEFLSPISEKLDFLAGIILVDCDDFEPKDFYYCQKDPEAKDGYPKMVIYKPPEYKVNPYTKEPNPHTEIPYDKKEVSEASIYNFITSHIINKSTKLNPDNIDNFLNNIVYNKVILFTDKTQTPLLFRGLSSFYYDRLLFGEVGKEHSSLLKRFDIKSFPTLLVYVTQEDDMILDEPRIEIYNDKIAARNIVFFINEYALPEKLYMKIKNTENTHDIKYKVAMKKLESNSDFMKYFEKFKLKRFIVYLSNEEEIPEDIKKFSKNANGFFNFVRFNCKNSEEFCKNSFNVKNIPSLLLINKFVLDENKNEITDLQKRFEKSINLSFEYNEIVNEILTEFPSDFIEANPQNFPSLISQANLKKRTPIVYLYEKEIPLGLHLFSTEQLYKKYVDLIIYELPTKEILKNLQIKTLPATIIMITNPEKPAKY